MTTHTASTTTPAEQIKGIRLGSEVTVTGPGTGAYARTMRLTDRNRAGFIVAQPLGLSDEVFIPRSDRRFSIRRAA